MIRLPFPPSANNMFLNVPGRGRIKSTEYRSWLTEAGLVLKQQLPPTFLARTEIKIDLDDTRKGDCDNRTKPILDLLVTHGVLIGDSKSCVKRVSIGWEKIDGCAVYINTVEGAT